MCWHPKEAEGKELERRGKNGAIGNAAGSCFE